MTVMDWRTGETLRGIDDALQSVEIILSTRIGSLVTLRPFGGSIVELLGRAITPTLFALFKQLLASAIDQWEPRFRVRQVFVDGSTDALRSGHASVSVEVDYRPRGHLGDFRVERVVSLDLNFRAGRVTVTS